MTKVIVNIALISGNSETKVNPAMIGTTEPAAEKISGTRRRIKGTKTQIIGVEA